MRAGKLRHKLSIQAQTRERDGAGQELLTWTEVCAIRADIDPRGGRERWLSDAHYPEADSVILCRWRPGIEARMRAVSGGRIYDIQNVQINREIRHQMVLICKQGINDG